MRRALVLLILVPLLNAAPDDLHNARGKLEKLAVALAKEGLVNEAAAAREPYTHLDPSERDLANLDKGIGRALGRARSKSPKASVLARHARTARNLAHDIVDVAVDRDGTPALLMAALALDSQCEHAHKILGSVYGSDGLWRTPKLAALEGRATKVKKLIAAARSLDVEVLPSEPTDPVLHDLYGKVSSVRHGGLLVQSYLPQERVESVLRDALRAMALSHALGG